MLMIGSDDRLKLVIAMMTPLDRLKLARDDYDQHERLYNTLALGLRFYIGTVALLGGWSLSLLRIDSVAIRWDSIVVLASTLLFWTTLAAAIFHIFQFIRGQHWTSPRTLDHYMRWEAERFKQVNADDFDLDGKVPADFAEDEMLAQMTGAYADSACVNRTGNLERQVQITKIGKVLLASVLALGLQGVAGMIFGQRHGNESKQSAAATEAATAATAGAGRHDGPK